MLNQIKFESTIEINDIPIQWIPRFELFYADLPQFPIVYIHVKVDDSRVYGFPVSVSFDVKKGSTCNVKILFLSNYNLEDNSAVKKVVGRELEERFGTTEKIAIKDILTCCRGQDVYENFFMELWKFLSKSYGDYLPYGRYYEEIFSIVRFVSAWQPKTGRQSEMRMLYNFLSNFGEKVPVEDKWDYLEFFLLPTYEDLLNHNFADFPKFDVLFLAMIKIWNIYFTEEIAVKGINIRSLKKSWPIAIDKFSERISYPLFSSGQLNKDDKEAIDGLVDVFNRHSWRAAFFIWSIMTAFQKDYYSWDKDFFIKFYASDCGVGISEKVVACFLQQGFGNKDVIPVDTWVEAFFIHILGIDTRDDFFNKFDNLGKLERAIWLASQANKTNIKLFFDTQWCTRYGDTGNNELRGANPISCYECKLRGACPGFEKVKNFNVLIKDKNCVEVYEKLVSTEEVIREAEDNGCSFICVTEDMVPKKIFKKIIMKKKGIYKLVDEFSGHFLKDQKLKRSTAITTVEGLINLLPPFFRS